MTTDTHPKPDPELLGCPFCGNRNVAVFPDEIGSGGQHVSPYHAACDLTNGGCGVSVDGETPEEAIAAWNRRSSSIPAGDVGKVVEALSDFDHELSNWAKAYPLAAFPEPDLLKAREVLSAAGMTLDSVSASAMRHAVTTLNTMFDKVRSQYAALASLRKCGAGNPADQTAAECDTGNMLLDRLMAHRFGTGQWPDNWMAVRDLLIQAQRLAASPSEGSAGDAPKCDTTAYCSSVRRCTRADAGKAPRCAAIPEAAIDPPASPAGTAVPGMTQEKN